MIEHSDAYHKTRPGRTILLLLGMLTGGAVVILWSWHSVAVDLFKLPAIQFKHAFALELLLLMLVLLSNIASSLVASQPFMAKETKP
jgi:hypothetical protein